MPPVPALRSESCSHGPIWVPLIPIQGFVAIPLSALAGAAMLLVVRSHHPVAQPVEP